MFNRISLWVNLHGKPILYDVRLGCGWCRVFFSLRAFLCCPCIVFVCRLVVCQQFVSLKIDSCTIYGKCFFSLTLLHSLLKAFSCFFIYHWNGLNAPLHIDFLRYSCLLWEYWTSKANFLKIFIYHFAYIDESDLFFTFWLHHNHMSYFTVAENRNEPYGNGNELHLNIT